MASELEIQVPDIGDFESVDVIDVLVKPGDLIRLEDPLVTLESDKATMDVPAPVAGRVLSIKVAVGDKVAQGRLLLTVEATEPEEAAPASTAPAVTAPAVTAPASVPATPAVPAAPTESASQPPVPVAPAVKSPPVTGGDAYGFNSPDPGPRTLEPPGSRQILVEAGARIYASPALRKFARELGVDLAQVEGSGRKQRITREDVTAWVKRSLTTPRESGIFATPPAPAIDFTRFGEVETVALSKIKRSSGQNLHRAWVSIPHVTQFDEADITDLEAFRKGRLSAAGAEGVKLTLMAFLLRALAANLRQFPDFNASLAPDGQALIRKKYLHLGVAVNTDRGLLVPVLRDVEHKGLLALAAELKDLSDKARAGKLAPADMQGACMTITSLGGIGGTGFTPIINPPEVAILGVSPAKIRPEWREDAFVPRLMLPLSLSYDHRVIDGVAAATFARHLCRLLSDIREIML